ncbi:hypothetical protein ZOSMA_1406G00010, partial [Zostera marina]
MSNSSGARDGKTLIRANSFPV